MKKAKTAARTAAAVIAETSDTFTHAMLVPDKRCGI
jgi:hypothetical protein